MFHVNNLRPCSTTSFRHACPVTNPKGDDEEFEVSHISVVCIKSLLVRGVKYLLFMTYFSDDDTHVSTSTPLPSAYVQGSYMSS
jgi:hypothetical protein